MKLLLNVLLAIVMWLVPAIVIGVFACIWFDVLPYRGDGAALPYVIWFVIGIFSGVFIFNSAGALIVGKDEWDWNDLATGNRVFWMAVPVLAVMMVLAWLFGGHGYAAEYFVPDSAPHTITFLVSVVLGMSLFRFVLMGEARHAPEGLKPKRRGRR